MSLDLHGIEYKEVPNAFDNYFAENYVPFEVITGKSEMMKNTVLEILTEYKLNYFNINEGSIMVVEGNDN